MPSFKCFLDFTFIHYKKFSAKKVTTFCCLKAVRFAAECYGILALRQFEKFKFCKAKNKFEHTRKLDKKKLELSCSPKKPLNAVESSV